MSPLHSAAAILKRMNFRTLTTRVNLSGVSDLLALLTKYDRSNLDNPFSYFCIVLKYTQMGGTLIISQTHHVAIYSISMNFAYPKSLVAKIFSEFSLCYLEK